jgi:copper(I)-binding protein
MTRPLYGGRGFFMVSTCLLLLLTIGAAQAQSPVRAFQVGHIQISRLRAAPTPPSASVAAIYLWITNSGSQADRLLSVSSPLAASAGMHSTTMTQGMMQMRAVEAVDIPPGVAIKMQPGGLHIMLQGLKQPLAPGSSLPLILEFRDAGMLTVQVPVKALE